MHRIPPFGGYSGATVAWLPFFVNIEFMKYYSQTDDEWVVMKDPNKHKIACCDCGLIHTFEFKLTEDDELMFRARRDNRATAQRRRKLKQKQN